MSSIHDVAKRAGVSTATVSRTFRSPGLLTEETQRRVLEAAKQLGYRPRRARSAAATTGEDAPRPREAREEAIGFQFFADRPADTLQSNAFYAPMLMGAQEEAAALGMHLLVHTTDRHRLAKELPKMVQDEAIAGSLLVGTGADPATLARFSERLPHLVLLDDLDPTGQFECVTSDGFGGMFEATNYLLGLGHRRIGFFLVEEEVRPFRERLHGYVSALFRAGITPDPAMVLGGRFEDPDEERIARLAALVTHPDPERRPTALLASNDDYAFYALRHLRRLGLRVPEDISLIGFDDTPFSTHTDPPLTTVRVDKEAMGRLAVQRLVARIRSPEGGTTHHPVHNQMPVSLVVRQSCCRPA
jgi:Transcriptional regulators